MKIQARILWLLARAADQQSGHIALHLKLSVNEVEAALEQLAQAGQVECVAVKRSQGTVRVYNLPRRAKVKTTQDNSKHPRDYCFSTSTLKAQPFPATVIASSGGP